MRHLTRLKLLRRWGIQQKDMGGMTDEEFARWCRLRGMDIRQERVCRRKRRLDRLDEHEQDDDILPPSRR